MVSTHPHQRWCGDVIYELFESPSFWRRATASRGTAKQNGWVIRKLTNVLLSTWERIRGQHDLAPERRLTSRDVNQEPSKKLQICIVRLCEHQTHTPWGAQTQWSLQFSMNYLKQTLGSTGQPSVWRECLMIAFYCSRRSRSSKLSFCSPQGARAAAVGVHSALCFYTRGEVGQAHSHRNVFTGGRHSGDTIILLFCPFVLQSGERVNPFGWDVSSARVWRWSNSRFGMIQHYLCACERTRTCVNCHGQNRPPVGL